MKYTIEQIRHAWLGSAEHEWKRVVRDDEKGVPGNRAIITGYFLDCGWGFHIPGGYVERANNPWCGIGLASAGRRLGDFLEPDKCVGVFLDKDIALNLLPSTDRMRTVSKWKSSGVPLARTWKLHSKLFLCAHDAIAREPEQLLVPGMVGTIVTRAYGDYRDEWGGHFVMIRYFDVAKSQVHTVEFNGRGKLGDGTLNQEGVVHAIRDLADFRVLYEFGLEHFEIMEK